MLKKKSYAFIPFIVAGHPSVADSERIVDLLVDEGVEILELGVPFSDAMADGPVIQAASEKASRVLTSMTEVLGFVARVHAKHPALSIILFTYFNPILKMGVADFSKRAKQAGAYGVLTVDLPPEEATEYRAILASDGLKTIFLASPTTSKDRMKLIAEASTGFIYYVSRTGVTGVQAHLSSSLGSEIAELRKITEKPIAIGFGISNGAQAAEVAKLGDFVVVGSALVRLISNHIDPAIRETQVRALCREIMQAVQTKH
jgi:tryptophan synthase alpha chain